MFDSRTVSVNHIIHYIDNETTKSRSSNNLNTKAVFTLNVDYDLLKYNSYSIQFYSIVVLFEFAKIQIQ